MANQGTPVVILGSTYYVPVASQDPNWGSDLHDTVVALADASSASSGPADIPTTSFSLANNTASPSNVTSAVFSTTLVRSFIMSYSIYISTTTTEHSANGTLYGNYKSTAATWDLAETYTGSDSGVTFSITSGGQIQYTTTNVGGSSYSGKLKFNAKVFLQA